MVKKIKFSVSNIRKSNIDLIKSNSIRSHFQFPGFFHPSSKMGGPFCGPLGLRVSGNKLNNVYYSICIFHIMFFFQIQMVVYLWALFNIWWFHLTPNRILDSYPVSASSDKYAFLSSTAQLYKGDFRIRSCLCLSAILHPLSLVLPLPTWEKNISRSNPPSTNNCRNPKQTFAFSLQKSVVLKEMAYAYID